MEAYVICFALTLAWAWINEKLLEKQIYNGLTWLSVALVILIPAILAGCRDLNIGTDVYVYAKNVFDAMLKYGWHGIALSSSPELQRIEPGFKFLAYVSGIVCPSVNFFLFNISLLIGGLVYLSLYNLRDNCSIFMGEAIYFFACYNETYNMMRQCIAMGFILVALSYFLKRKYILSLPWVVLAYSFHIMAIFAIPILVIAYVMEQINFGINWLKLLILCGILAVVVTVFKELGMILILKGMLPQRYIGYLKIGGEISIDWHTFVKYSIPYTFLLLGKRNIKYFDAFIAFALCDIMLYPLRYQLDWLYRISSFFFYIRIISLSQLRLDFVALWYDKKLSLHNGLVFGLLMVLAYLWYNFSIESNWNETYPYTSKLLDIYIL